MVSSHKGTLDTERKAWLVCHALRKTPFFQCFYSSRSKNIFKVDLNFLGFRNKVMQKLNLSPK
jgi:hypothetical protein